jgi:hypothetical protein
MSAGRISVAAFQDWCAEQHALHEDPSWLLCELLDRFHPLWFVPSPRRPAPYVSMLRCFLEKNRDDCSALFEGLAVWRHETARRQFQRHPVIAMSFRGIADEHAANRILCANLAEHAYLRNDPRLKPYEAVWFECMAQRAYKPALDFLIRWLRSVHGERVVVLVDHYDAMLSVSKRWYAEQWITHNLLNHLRDNSDVALAVLIGRSDLAARRIQCVRLSPWSARRRWIAGDHGE